MLYYIVKYWVRAALFVYFKQIRFSKKDVLNIEGPLILACNHPNSFLDAIVLGAKFNKPVHFLARGDAFKKPLVKKIFTALKMIPIYRISEGRENLLHNDETFERCSSILKNNGIVLIFSEGLCIHEWKLRNLKKGTARIAIQAYNDIEIGKKIKVLPVGLNYTSFKSIGKNLFVNWGDIIYIKDQINTSITGIAINEFNEKLNSQLLNVVLSKDKTQIHFKNLDLLYKIVFFLPALIGYIVSIPFYLLMKKLVIKINRKGIFYDSLLFGFSLLLYPIYVLLISTTIYIYTDSLWSFLIIILAPLFAASSIRVFSKN